MSDAGNSRPPLSAALQQKYEELKKTAQDLDRRLKLLETEEKKLEAEVMKAQDEQKIKKISTIIKDTQ